ncbi:NADH dehydrogenase [ubiquinone] 1 beta subcomplex subunit 8, mitochondrial-like isoform X1 [Brassica napus]|uniref:NADH dehydrogenase [ubiquinone] 1 beta subcomplex subunit 8, mitochondrial-like isoform X1 n=1 Tax=Brassica napus TaxID=3708 RepID=UPI0006AB0997|nr:NADH dehydrogenase [ubiquinone] 1 beta subcomplex subunit 8, mitochondrial-like isoform X1 [Brassica napus]
MAGRLFGVASRIMGGNGVVARSGAASLRQRAGMGLPVGKHIVPDKRLSVNDELMWDNGTAFPEPCIDRIADTVGKYEALGWLCGGLGFFATLGLLAVVNDKASKVPFPLAKNHRRVVSKEGLIMMNPCFSKDFECSCLFFSFPLWCLSVILEL